MGHRGPFLSSNFLLDHVMILRVPEPAIPKRCSLYRVYLKLRSENKKLRNLAIVDPLTGLYNVRHFVSVLRSEMERAKRTGAPLSLIILDIDYFKSVNDRYGHPTGDMILKSIAAVLKDLVRLTDTVCRYGGEEFIIILPGTSIQQAVKVAERIRKAIQDKLVKVGTNDIRVTASFGIATFLGDKNESVQSFIDRADQCLLKAKRLGRNQVVSEALPPDTQMTPEEKRALFAAFSDRQH